MGTRIEAIGRGLYTTGQAAALARMPRAQVRRWMRGYAYRDRSGERRRASALVRGDFPLHDDTTELSFHDLVELLFVRHFLSAGVSMRMIRRAAMAAATDFGTNHPFSLRRFETDGRSIFQRLLSEASGDEHLYDVVRKQGALNAVINPLLRQIDYEDDEAASWHPLGKRRQVVVDPARSFGAPITAQSSVRTAVIYAAHRAGEGERRIADWYSASVGEVRAAIAFQRSLEAAA